MRFGARALPTVGLLALLYPTGRYGHNDSPPCRGRWWVCHRANAEFPTGPTPGVVVIDSRVAHRVELTADCCEIPEWKGDQT
ncbi:MAG: hypothetical protein ACRDTF_12775 [Pseudonocardiaceae bacterium]